MEPEEMDRLVDLHIKAELARDFDTAVEYYTEDIEHDFVGSPVPAVGREAAKQVYINLDRAFTAEDMTLTRRYHGKDFCVTEHRFVATVKGEFPGVPPGVERVETRLLHLFEFRDGLISRENAWVGPFLPAGE